MATARKQPEQEPAGFDLNGFPNGVYIGMLLLAAAFWGMGTVVIKDAIDSFPPLWLVGIRFILAGALSSLACWRRIKRNFNRDTLAVGALLGVFVALSYLFNTGGLVFTTASKSVFYTNTYCIMMPFIIWVIMRRAPLKEHFAAAGLCVAGIAMVTFAYGVGTVNFNVGDALTLCSALAVGIHLALVARFSEGRDVLALTCIQFLVCGVVSLSAGAICHGPLDVSLLGQPDVLRSLAYLVIFASCAALMLQNVAMANVDTMTGSLLLATECIFGTVFAVIFLGESLNFVTVCGFALIGIAIAVSEVLSSRAQT